MRIDARLIEDEVGREIGQHTRQRVGQYRQIGVVAGAVLQPDIERRARLAHRKILFRMDRQGEYVATPGQQRRGAIPLMHVEVEDQDARGLSLRDQAVGGDGEVVEDAIASARIGQCMMAAARRIGGIAMDHGQFRRQPCAARRQQRSAHDPLRHRKADPARFFRRDGQRQHFVDIGRIMDRIDPDAVHGFGFN